MVVQKQNHGTQVGGGRDTLSSPTVWQYSSANRNGEDQVNLEAMPLVHKVSIPPKVSAVKDFEGAVKETFFPDDPLRQFKNKTGRKKLSLGLQYVFPILEWGRRYSVKIFPADLIAGLTIASLAVPQDLGYARLAGVPPVNGLYSSFVPPLVYSVLGSSRDIAIGPVAVVSILLGTLLKNEIPNTNDPNYLRLAFTATFFAGVFQASLGILRLGFIIDFLSHAAIVGFMAGAAITIGLQQLNGLLGIKTGLFTNKTGFIAVMQSVFQKPIEWNWQSIVIGVAFLTFLIGTKLLAKKKKKMFFLAAIAPLLSVILATLIVYLARLDRHGVKIVGHIRKGINPPSAHQIFWTGKYVATGVKIGLVAAFIALTEAIAIGRTFASLKDYHLDGNKEMIAYGVMNMCGAVTSCYVSTGSFSRSAVNYQAGVRTAVSNIVMAIVVMVVLLAITPLFHYTPNCILSAIIIAAVISLIDVKAALLIWKVDKLDFLACLGAFFGVFFVSVEIGLAIAVGISFLKILLHTTRPHTAVLGNIPGTSIYRNVTQYPNASRVPGVLLIRIDAAIYFSNSNYVRERILRYVVDEEDRLKATPNSVPLQYVIIDLTPVMNIDTTGIIAFEELLGALRRQKFQLALANPGSGVIEKFQQAKFIDLLGSEWFFLTAGEAIQVVKMLLNKSTNTSIVDSV